MTNTEKIEFYRTFLNQMEKDFRRWGIPETETKNQIRALVIELEIAQLREDDGMLPHPPHPRLLPSGRIAKRWEWWLSRSWFGRVGLFKVE